jgi:hypothetical protein
VEAFSGADAITPGNPRPGDGRRRKLGIPSGGPPRIAELSPRTFCTFCASSRHSGGTGLLTGSDPDSGHGSAHLTRATCGPRFSRLRLQTHGSVRSSWSEGWSVLAGHAAASTDGHLSHDADRLASTRVRRAAAARDVRPAGTASPVPKYISSGVCPRNAECGSTRLCSST